MCQYPYFSLWYALLICLRGGRLLYLSPQEFSWVQTLTDWRRNSLLQRFYLCLVHSERVPGADYAFTELLALACLNCQERNSNHSVINLLSVSNWELKGNPGSIRSWSTVLISEITSVLLCCINTSGTRC